MLPVLRQTRAQVKDAGIAVAAKPGASVAHTSAQPIMLPSTNAARAQTRLQDELPGPKQRMLAARTLAQARAAMRRSSEAIGLAEQIAKTDFIAPRSGAPAASVAPPADPRPTHLLIPSITLDTAVVEVPVVDGTWEVAEYAAGYMQGTGLPGDPGNMGISGHLGLRGAVFANLAAVAVGADVFVELAGWRYQYRVREISVIWPGQIEVLDPTLSSTLTLLTCTNWDTQRLAVTADQVGAEPLPGIAVLHFRMCAVFLRVTQKNRTRKISKYLAAAGKTPQL